MAGLISEQESQLDAGLREWAEPEPDAVDIAALDEVVAEARELVATSRLLPDQATRQRLASYVQAVSDRREQLLSPLQIAIVGGTGVGKSTLLNALAGDAIVRMSEQRPCTQEVSAYVHEANELVVDPGAVPAGHRFTHDREGLRDKILIDTPDYDSIDRDHRRRLAEALRGADVVLWVTTAEKYADLAGSMWLREYGPGRLFVFVLNRADEGIDPSVAEDVSRHVAALGFPDAPLLQVSARRALEAEQGLGEPFEDDFERLETLLEEELDAKRIRAVKEGNFQGLVLRLARHIASAVPSGGRDRLRRWREAGDAAYGELHDELVTWLAPRVEGDPRLEKHIEYWFGTGFAGPLGAVLTLSYGLRATLSPLYPRLWQVSEIPELDLAADRDDATRLAGAVASVQARLLALGTDIGLPGADNLEPAPSAESLTQDLEHRLRGAVGEAIRHARSGPSRAVRLVNAGLNTPALLVLIGLPVWFVVDQLRPLVGATPLLAPGPYWQATLVAIVLTLALLGWLGQIAVRVRTRRFIERLRLVVSRAVDEVVRTPLTGRLEAWLQGLADEFERLRRLLHRAGAEEGRD